MRKFRTKREDQGVSNVVATIMLLAIFMSLLGMIMSTYLPAWARTNEATHMLDAADSFLMLKSNIDTQILRSEVDTTMTTTMTLGARGGPLFGVGRSSGSLMMEDFASNNSMYNSTELMMRGKGAINFTTNNYYLDNQRFHYEHGGVILEQGENSVMKFAPNIHIRKNNNDIVFSATLITLRANGVDRAQGTSTVAIRTTLLTKEGMTYLNQTVGLQDAKLRIYTAFTATWTQYFTETCQAGGLAAGDFTVTENAAGNWVEILVRDCTKTAIRQAVVEVEFEK